MEKIKVSEASGAVLDYMVAQCEGVTYAVTHGYPGSVYDPITTPIFTPSTDWAQGGPIIEGEKIDTWVHARKFWSASKDKGATEFRGPTPLIAAMRCYVASKLGEEVEVPREIIKGI